MVAGHRDYRRYLIARAAMALATGAVGFVVVAGIAGALRPSDAAIMAAVFVLAQAFVGFGLAILGNRFGYRLVAIIGAVLIAAGMTAAMLATDLLGFAVALALLGGANSLTFVCDPSMSIEFAPPGRTSVYLGTTLTVLAPFFIVGPLIVGAVIALSGAPAVFAVSAVLAVVGGLLALRVREPRRAAAAQDPRSTPTRNRDEEVA